MFSEDEKKILEPFMTNLDKPIFVLKNLPEVVKGALFARYSRSSKSLREVLLHEFIQMPESGFKDIVNYSKCSGHDEVVAIKKAEEFYDRVLVGYGDDSVAELAGVHIAIEDISNIAVKFIQDARIGICPLEKSTRYVYFDEKDSNGKWLYIQEPKIMQSEFADEYMRTCNHLFETYAKLKPKVSKYVEEKYPRGEESERAYTSTIRAKTCDLLRGLLPASTKTNMGAFGNGRAFEYLITKMYASDLEEVQNAAKSIHEELKKAIPSFVKRCDSEPGKVIQQYWKDIRKNMAKESENFTPEPKINTVPQVNAPVRLVEYDNNALNKLVAFALFETGQVDLNSLMDVASKLPESRKLEIFSKYVGQRKNRRMKPGRVFENVYYTFEICANYGCFRDIHRHRILTQQRQLLTTDHGYDLPKELIEGGFESEFKEAMKMADETYRKIAARIPEQAQYVVPFAHKLRWYMTMNLREAYHFCELRSAPQGHIDYRKVAQEMYQQIHNVHPFVEMQVDMKEYGLERLEAEKWIDKRIEEVKKKYSN